MKPSGNPIVTREAPVRICGRPARVRVYIEDGLYVVRNLAPIEADPEQRGELAEIAARLARGVLLEDLGIWRLFDRDTIDDLMAPRHQLYDSKGEKMTYGRK